MNAIEPHYPVADAPPEIQIDLDAAAELLRVMGHATRLTLLQIIGDQELSVGDIEQRSGVGQPTLSQQLAVLRKAGMVEARRQAKQVFYRLNPDRLSGLITYICHLGGMMGVNASAILGAADAVSVTTIRKGYGDSAAVFAKIL